MAVPKGKVSKARRDSRRHAENKKLSSANLVECPHCHELKVAHLVCKKCGYYNGVERVKKDEQK